VPGEDSAAADQAAIDPSEADLPPAGGPAGAAAGSAADEPATDPSAHPLSAAGLWNDERPPRMVRVPDEAAGPGPDIEEGSAVEDATATAAAAGRSMVHPPDGRAAGSGAGVTGRRQRDPVRATVRGVGQLLITAGVVVLLFVVYELWITNIFGGHRQAAATQQLDKLWATEQVVVTQGGAAIVTENGDSPTLSGLPAASSQAGARTRHYDTTEGAGFAKLYVPTFGADFVFTVIEGTNENDLYAGPGHYLGTQYPGEPGNFALAGHRVNKGAPFNDLELLNSCDAIVIETVDTWYVYRVLPMQDQVDSWGSTSHPHCDGVAVQDGQYSGVYGREITDPGDYQQVLPVPHVNSTAVPKGAESLITLTTCNPKFSDAQRMIVHGVLVKSYPKKGSFLPPELGETT
jgi:sortase (surface protein transpeptidase)